MGRWKLFVPFGGSTIVQAVVRTALEACPRVVLVAGYRAVELAAVFADEPRVTTVVNERWFDGMFGSIRMGVAAVRTRRFFVTLADMPWISAESYAALALRAESDSEADVVFPVHGGVRGHPVLFHERVRHAVSLADPDGASMRLIAESFRVREVEWPDDSILRDVDTEADLPH